MNSVQCLACWNALAVKIKRTHCIKYPDHQHNLVATHCMSRAVSQRRWFDLILLNFRNILGLCRLYFDTHARARIRTRTHTHARTHIRTRTHTHARTHWSNRTSVLYHPPCGTRFASRTQTIVPPSVDPRWSTADLNTVVVVGDVMIEVMVHVSASRCCSGCLGKELMLHPFPDSRVGGSIQAIATKVLLSTFYILLYVCVG